MSARPLLVTSALPYANGHIHLGHLVEYIQTDIWVRYQKLRGNRCVYICADDTHGTAIMMRARQEKRPETELIADMRAAHLRDFTGFGITFDNYGSTHGDDNRDLCAQIWAGVRKAGLVVESDVSQLYDTQAGTFLADRFVKGTCPKCGAADQYGDNCEVCGSTYSPAELKDPVSTLTGTRPEVRTARHLFIRIESLHEFLAEWTQSGDHLQSEIANYLRGHFLGEPLRDWDVSRPQPYFGFEIPDSPGNCWYVWFDAPIGYIASTREWCRKQGEEFANWWPSGPGCDDPARGPEIHHFIGKDITYFHTLFWPAMLKAAQFRLPKQVHIHGFLTINGEKMSKRRGTFIMANTYLAHLDPAYLRYYYATKLTGSVEDLDLNLDDFANKANSDLVGKVVNLASRTARFVEATGLSEIYPDDGGLFADFAAAGEAIAKAYEALEFGSAMRQIMALADRANQYVDQQAPWTLRKDPAKAQQVRDVCTATLNLFRQLVIYLSPVLPKLAEQTGALLHSPIGHWSDAQTQLTGTPVSPFQHLMKRVEPAQVQAMLSESADKAVSEASQTAGPVTTPATTPAGAATPASPSPTATPSDGTPAVVDTLAAEPLAETCSVDDFFKVDLRVGKVLAAEEVKESKKLIKVTLSLGGDVTRTVYAGIKTAYDPQTLVGRLVIFCANLAPRTMKLGKTEVVSEGMICAAGSGGKEIFVLSPDAGALPGHRIH